MTAIVTINNVEFPILNYRDQRVITTEYLAQLYGTETVRIRQNYNRNPDRFDVGKHFFKVEGDELSSLKILSPQLDKHTTSLTLWTERGAARHAKMLETDQAWEVFEKLEDAYFDVVPPKSLPVYPVVQQCEKPRAAQLPPETLEALQHLKTDLRIDGWLALHERPVRPSPLDCVALLGAVLDDILQWRYPHYFAYGFDIVGKAYVMIRLSDLVYHLRKATHFKDFFSMMHGKAERCIARELLHSGLLLKARSGPRMEDAHLNYRLYLAHLNERRQQMKALESPITPAL